MKILIIANAQKWDSWDKKTKELVDWFKPIEIDFDIVHTKIKDIPYEDYGMFDGHMRKGVNKVWFKEELTDKYPGYDAIILSINKKDWKCTPVEGWQWGGESIAVASNESGSYNFKGVNYPGNKWVNLVRHELIHLLYTKQGKTDNTHKYYDTGILDQVKVELIQPTIITTIKNIMNPPTKYRYFNYSEVEGLDPKLVQMLDDARHIAGTPFKINSGFRTKEQNEKAGGVKDSAHMTGKAVDIACTSDSNRWKIITALQSVGFNRIGIAATFVHADIDTTKSASVIWLYK